MRHGTTGDLPLSSRWALQAMSLALVLALGSDRVHAQAPEPDQADTQQEVVRAVTDVKPIPSPSTGVQQSANFWHRLGDFYLTDWKAAPSTEPVARRALAAPLNSPPFPSSDWGYGGSTSIGVPDGNVYPVMSALREEKSRIKLYGWVEASGNASTSSSKASRVRGSTSIARCRSSGPPHASSG